MKFNKSNAYTDFDYETAEEMPDALPLNIISGGCHLYGYLLKPRRAVRRTTPGSRDVSRISGIYDQQRSGICADADGLCSDPCKPPRCLGK